MHYHLILTQRCNLNCGYCGGTRDDASSPEVEYPLEALQEFIAKDPEPVLVFYGGEPLLRMDLMEELMDRITATYLLHTNGLFLDRVRPEYLKRFHTILVSMDGRQEVTDAYRGEGVYARAVKTVKRVREDFPGDLIARMVASLKTDIYQDVLHLAGLGVFDHVHWQLDFELFWDGGTDEGKEWLKGYNQGISRLVRKWVHEMKGGRVLGLVPFIGITNTLLSGEPTPIRCGAGHDFFSIAPSGDITLCPVTPEYEFMRVGHITETKPEDLQGCAPPGEPCASCDIRWVCGGRCIFINRVKDWVGEEGYGLICSTVRHLVAEMEGALPEIRGLIENGTIPAEALDYPKINNDCEIIP
jgi:putative peptide-modifying radical SAM enzyme